MTTFTQFSTNAVPGVQKDTSTVLISGNPVHTVWLHFSGANDTFRSGIWHSTAGRFRGPMNDQIEFCHIIEGAATITIDDGTVRSVKAGDSFVMDNGLQPVWHVENAVKKSFVIMQTPTDLPVAQ